MNQQQQQRIQQRTIQEETIRERTTIESQPSTGGTSPATQTQPRNTTPSQDIDVQGEQPVRGRW
jgi:hypothetical protein